MEGWIVISRDIVNHWIWEDDKKYKWWSELLIMAAWKDREVMHDSHKFILRRGQLIASVAFLNKKWGGDPKTTLRFLKLLEKEGMIIREVCHRQTPIITICNYDKYQRIGFGELDRQTETLMETQTETQTDRQTDRQRETNRINRIKKRNIFSPDGEKCAHAREEISCEDFMNAWNEICISLSKVKSLPDRRKQKIKLRVAEMETIEKVREIFTRIEASDYCRGSKGWKVTFDWIIDNSINWRKVDEGNYDNNPITPRQNDNDTKRSGDVAESATSFKRKF